MKKILLFLLLIGLYGCVSTNKELILPLSSMQQTTSDGFKNNVYMLRTNMTPEQVKEIMGKPDLIDKETDIHIKNQDTVWTYKHPVIACARFIVIFRNNGIELAIFAVKDIDGVSHYLTNDEFEKK